MQVLLAAITLVLFFFGLRQFFIADTPKYLRNIFGILILSRVLLNVFFMMAKGEFLMHFPFLLKCSAPFFYASPAFVYLYLRGLMIPQMDWKKRDYLHFLPALFGVLEVLPWYFQPHAAMLTDVQSIDFSGALFFQYFTGPVSERLGYVIKPALQIFYLIWAFKLARETGFFKESSGIEPKRHWVGFILAMLTLAFLIQCAQLVSLHTDLGSEYFNFSPLELLLILNIMILVVFLLFVFQKPVMLTHFMLGYTTEEKGPSLSSKVSAEMVSEEIPEKSETGQDDNNSREVLTAEESEQLFLRAEALIMTASLFRQHQLHVAQVASSLEVPVHHLSFCLNKYKGLTFREWVNQHRINAFLEDYPRLNQTMTIEAQAQACGFKNSSGFYLTFKKYKGCSPKEFLQKASDYQ